MAKNIINFFTRSFDEASLLIKSKCRMLAWTAVALGIVGSIAGILMMLTGAVIAGSMGVVYSLLAVLALIFLRKGKPIPASALVIYGLWAIFFVAIKFDAYQNVYETYVWGTIGGVMLIVTALLSTNMYLVIITGILNGLGTVFAAYISRSQLTLITTIETQDAIVKVAEQNQDILAFFHNVGGEIQGLADMIQELLLNVQEISSGSKNVMEAVETVAALTCNTELTVTEAWTSIEHSSEGIASILSISERVLSESAEMAKHFDRVQVILAQLQTLGDVNRKAIDAMWDQVLDSRKGVFLETEAIGIPEAEAVYGVYGFTIPMELLVFPHH